ncbi:MAG: hypothetical protein Q9164_007299, partial [Protoblastenia rupestris]
MDSLQFYEPTAKPGVRSNGRSTTSNLRIPSSRWEGKDSMALGASQKPSGVPYNPNLTQSQNGTGPLQKDSLDSFRAREMSLNGTKADKEMASILSKDAVASWDDMIPLSYQRASDRPHRPRFGHPLGIICKTGVLDNPIEVDSGHDSSDDSGSESRHEASSATTSTCAISPGVSRSNEGQMKNTETGGKEAGGLVAAALNPQEQQNSSWLDIDHFFNSDLEAEDGAAEGKCQETGNFEDKPGPDSAKDGQAGDGSQDMHHSVNRAKDGPGDGDGVKHCGEDVIADPEMEGFEVDGEGFHSKDGHRAGVGVDTEGRGRPPRSRTAITVSNAVWEVTKIAGDEQSGEGRVLKISSISERPSQYIGVSKAVSRAVRGVKGIAYVVDKGGVRAEGWCSFEAQTLIFYLGPVVLKTAGFIDRNIFVRKALKKLGHTRTSYTPP